MLFGISELVADPTVLVAENVLPETPPRRIEKIFNVSFEKESEVIYLYNLITKKI
jgi:hypothetical protein